MALTRRDFMRAAALTGVAGAGLLAGCADGNGGAAQETGSGGVGTGPNGESQVIVTMTPSSEPAAGFDPLMGWGAGEHVHEPSSSRPSSPPTTI